MDTRLNDNVVDLQQYNRKGRLTWRKLREYIPVMTVTNLSLLLINMVDQMVAGNFIGKEAMSSVSVLHPAQVFIGVFSVLPAIGIATAISTAMGSNDTMRLAHIKTAGVRIMVVVAIIASIIQVPIMWRLIASYGVSQELSSMIWQYAIGCMISTPLSIVSTVGNLQLQIAGKMKIIMLMTMAEGILNLVFDLLFVAVFDMGVAGVGYGTACANLIRGVSTVIYISKCTDLFKGDRQPVTARDFSSILYGGVPEASFHVILAMQNYFMLRIIINCFGEDGGVIYGVCLLCTNIASVLFNGIQGGIRPLMGLFAGAGDGHGLDMLMRQGVVFVILYSGVATAAIMMFPDFLYHINGVNSIPDGGIMSVRLYAVSFLIMGFNYLLRVLFTNMKEVRFATALNVVNCVLLPLFAYMIASLSANAPLVFLAYTFTEFFILAISVIRLITNRKSNIDEDKKNVVVYMTVHKEDATYASQLIRKYAEEKGINKRIAFRIALCLEEMAAYMIDPKSGVMDIIIRFTGKDSAVMVTLDDGEFIALDEDEVKQEMITDNYELIRNISTSVEYQYVLNMNHMKIELG